MSAHPTLQYLRNSLDFTPYIETAANRLRALRMPEQYSSAIYSASSRMNEAVSDVIDLEAMKQVKQAYSEVYQQVIIVIFAFRDFPQNNNCPNSTEIHRP